jgi:hypothetical protein
MAKKDGKDGVLCAALTALLIAAVFCGCKEREKTSDASWNEVGYTETTGELPSDPLEGPHDGSWFTINQFREYYGNYNGYFVGTVLTPLMTNWQIDIDGIIFHAPSPLGVVLWKDGTFYPLRYAYDLGFLTRGDLIMIADAQKNGGIER